MTVTNTSPLLIQQDGNGIWTTLSTSPAPVPTLANGTHGVQVVETSLSNGSLSTLVEGVDYTVTLTGVSPSVATITFATAPSALVRITVSYNIPLTQEIAFQNGTVIDVTEIESGFDNITLQMQSIQGQVNRAVLLAQDTLTQQLTLPSLTNSVAGQVIAVNPTLNGFTLANPTTATASSLGLTSTASSVLVAGSGITITPQGTNQLVFANTATTPNTFGTIAVPGQTSIIAASSTDTLTMAAGTNISLTTSGETVTINNTLPSIAAGTNISISTTGGVSTVSSTAGSGLNMVTNLVTNHLFSY